MNASKGVTVGTTLFVTVTTVTSLIAVFYFGWKVMGLPFVPFDVFDWLTRVLPGRVIAFGIETMVTIIRRADVAPTATAAKLAEQAMAITGFFGTCVVAGVIYFRIARMVRRRHTYALGLAFGIAA